MDTRLEYGSDKTINNLAAHDAQRMPRANGAIARLAYARAKAAGVAMEPLLRAAHLTPFQIENPAIRLRVRDQIQFLNLVADALGDDFLGFHLALLPDLREFGLIYYVMASAETLNDALQRGAHYSSIINEGIALKCMTNENPGISFRYVGVNRHPDRHQMEFWLTAFVRVCRQLTSAQLLPSRVRLVHFRGHTSAELSAVFGGNVEFGAPSDEIVLPAKAKQMPVVSADPYLNKLLVSYCEEALAGRRQGEGSFRSSVENALVPLLPHGKARATEIAKRLGVGQRTFARRLLSEGLTFSELLQSLRVDLANRYLADRELSISQVAWLLGYQEVSGFSHAFKRWSGKTPREMRGLGRGEPGDAVEGG